MATQQRQQRVDPAERVLGDLPPESGVPVGQAIATMQTAPQEVFTARRTDKPRDYANIKRQLQSLAASFGESWVYSWEVNDRQNNRKVKVEGGTIKMANAISRVFGNCVIDVRTIDNGAQWLFYGRFVDLETGYQLTRAYQQRKQQSMGMRDGQRELDMVFQSGQSKCIRNVILNALPDLEQFCREEAKGALIGRVKGNPEGAREAILKRLDEMGVDRKRVETIYARTAKDWTVFDMAKIYTELQSIADGFMNASDLWPLPSDEPKEEKPKGNGKDVTEAEIVLGSEAKAAGAQVNESGTAPATEQATQADAPQGTTSPESKPAGARAVSTANIGTIALIVDGKNIGMTNDASLKAGDPIAVQGVEYLVVRRTDWLPEGSEDPVPGLLLAQQPGQDKPAANQQQAAAKPTKGSKKLF